MRWSAHVDADGHRRARAGERLLREETLGLLGVSGEDSVRVVPPTHCYQDGTDFFHGGPTGKKTDSIRRDPRVCLTVAQQAGPPVRHPEGGPCQVESDSVICSGTARILEDVGERRDALDVFDRRMDPCAGPITVEVAARHATVGTTRPPDVRPEPARVGAHLPAAQRR